MKLIDQCVYLRCEIRITKIFADEDYKYLISFRFPID